MAEAWVCQKQGVKNRMLLMTLCWCGAYCGVLFISPVEWFLDYRLTLEKQQNCNMMVALFVGGRKHLTKASCVGMVSKTGYIYIHLQSGFCLWCCGLAVKSSEFDYCLGLSGMVLWCYLWRPLNRLVILPQCYLQFFFFSFFKGKGHCNGRGAQQSIAQKDPPPPPPPPVPETLKHAAQTHAHIHTLWRWFLAHDAIWSVISFHVWFWKRKDRSYRLDWGTGRLTGGLFRSLAQEMFFAVVAVAQMLSQAYLCVCVCH